MDLTSLLGNFATDDALSSLAQAAGLSTDEVKNVLGAALPSMLNGAVQQATNEETAGGFKAALGQHSAADTSNVRSFFSNADTTDGEKIVHHLIGNDDAAVDEISERAGVSSGKTMMILALAAPLLMSLLGKQTSQQQASNSSLGIGDIMGGLLGGGSSSNSSLLGGLLGGGSSSSSNSLLGGLFGGGSSNSGSSDLLGSILGGLFK